MSSKECSWTGYISPYFITDNERWWWNLKTPDPAHRQENQHHPGFDSRLESRAGQPLLIIAEDVDGEALAMVVNKARGYWSVCDQSAWIWRSPQSHAARHRRSDWWSVNFRRSRT